MATRKSTRRRTTKSAESNASGSKPDDNAASRNQQSSAKSGRGEAVRAHLGEAGAHLKAAARAAADTLGSAVGEAASAASVELGEGSGRVRESLHDAGSSGVEALRAGTSPELDHMLTKGREFTASAEALIRARPVAAFGTALVAGYLLARMLRRG